MSDLNSCSFVGRVTKDAEVSSVGSKGTKICKFGIANNTGFGEYAKANFFNVQMWGKQGEAIAPYLTKGKQVAVSGSLESNKWSSQDGTAHENWTLTVNSITLLADSKTNSASVSQEPDSVTF